MSDEVQEKFTKVQLDSPGSPNISSATQINSDIQARILAFQQRRNQAQRTPEEKPMDDAVTKPLPPLPALSLMPSANILGRSSSLKNNISSANTPTLLSRSGSLSNNNNTNNSDNKIRSSKPPSQLPPLPPMYQLQQQRAQVQYEPQGQPQGQPQHSQIQLQEQTPTPTMTPSVQSPILNSGVASGPISMKLPDSPSKSQEFLSMARSPQLKDLRKNHHFHKGEV